MILESVNKNNEAEIIPYDPMRHNPNGDSVRVLMPDNGFDNNFESSPNRNYNAEGNHLVNVKFHIKF